MSAGQALGAVVFVLLCVSLAFNLRAFARQLREERRRLENELIELRRRQRAIGHGEWWKPETREGEGDDRD